MVEIRKKKIKSPKVLKEIVSKVEKYYDGHKNL